MKIAIKLLFAFLFSFSFLIQNALQAQTTYNWIGGTGSWAVAANWSSVPGNNPRTTPAVTDILQFNDGGTYTVSAIPNQTIGKLLITDDTEIILQSSGTTTLSIIGPAFEDNLLVEDGSTLQLGPTNNLTLRFFTNANQQGNISGIFNLNSGTFQTSTVATTRVKVTSTGIVNHFLGTFTGSVATLEFEASSNYNYLGTGALTIPLATWDTNSNVNITGITTAATIGGISTQSFGNFNYNCTSQGNVVVSLYATATTGISFTVKGNFNLQSTGAGTGSLSFKTNTGGVNATVNGLFSISGGLLNVNAAATTGVTLSLNGGYFQSGGTFNSSTANIACTINIAGSFDQSGGVFTRTAGTTITTINFTGVGDFIISGGTHTNTLFNYNVAANGNLTMQNNLELANSRQFTVAANGRLNFGTYNISGVTSTIFSVASGGTVSLGDQLGITTTGATGNVQTNTRTFHVGGHYIYSGTNGQVTGNALPLAITGSVTVNLSDGGALTFSNTGAHIGNTTATSILGTLSMVNGSVANQVVFNTSATTLEYAGIAAQTSTDNEFPATNGPKRLTINNPNGVTLHASRTLPVTYGVLTLNEGVLNTTSSELLTIVNTAVAAVVGGSVTSYVNGPLIRQIPATTSVYSFPVGKTDYAFFDILPQTTTSAAQYIQVEYFASAPGGSSGANFSSIEDRYWSVQRNSGTGNLNNIKVKVSTTGINIDSRIGYSSTLTGSYDNIGGLVSGNEVTSVNSGEGIGFFTIGESSTLSGTITSYINLTEIANVLRTNIVTGDVIFELPTSYSGEPAYPVVFTEFATSGPLYNVTIRPASTSINFLTEGSPAANIPLIDLVGIDRLTIDGRAGGSGGIVWTFRNTNIATTAGATFRFINDATFNTLTYLNVEGQNITAASGTIFFSTSAGGTLGNSENTISFCHIKDITASATKPVNGIFSFGTASVMNANNQILNNDIYNFWSPSVTSAGIFVSNHSTDWTISNNHLYQTDVRTGNTASIIRYGINVFNNVGDDFIITDNYIGGSAPFTGGTIPWTILGNFAHSFVGIQINPITSANNSIVENNFIRNIALTHGSTTTNPFAFIGIRSDSGNNLIQGNTVGSQGTTNKISITSTGFQASNHVYGIYISAGVDTILNNLIAGIELTSTAVGCGLTGIFLGSSGNANVEDNTISHLSSAFTGTAAVQLRGIGTSVTGINTINGNTIFNLSTSAANAGVNHAASVIGIAQSSTTAGQSLARNTIHSLSNNAATAQVNIHGITFSASVTAGVNNVFGNFIHSLSLNTSNLASQIIGITGVTGIASFYNNMIRLGIDADGNSITNGYVITGIEKIILTNTHRQQFYFNTIYIGGQGVTLGSSNTYGFRKFGSTASVANTEHFKNNIVINDRTNAGGTGVHYAMELLNTGFFESDHNLFRVDASDGRLGLVTSTSTTYNSFTDWQNLFANNDVNSIYGPAGFINATGNATSVNLRIVPSSASQVESNGIEVPGLNANINITVNDDIDGDARGAYPNGETVGTAPDIGADEGDFLAADLTPPTIIYTPLNTQTTLTAPALNAVQITDNSGINITPGTRPRLYFKYATNANTFVDNTNTTNGWKFVESPTGSSPFDFTIDYALLFGGVPVGTETIEYFVVAQDLAAPANVAINSGDFNALPSSVNLTAAAFPITGTINSYLINVLSGTVTVGASGTYPSLTNDGGLFQAINLGALSGNLTAEIISDLTAETGLHGLNEWIEVGAGTYTLTIQPNNNTNRIISGNYAGTNALTSGLIRFDGADRVIIDGRDPGNISAGGRHLLFRNINTGAWAATINYVNDAQNHTLQFLNLEGASTSATNGVVRISTASATGVGNDFITIDNCHIRDRSDAAGTPANGIYSLGTSARVNDNITISNNEIYNFWQPTVSNNGIFVAGFNSNWTIENNSFYQTSSPRIGSGIVTRYGIQITNTTGDNFIVRNNHIGGSAPLSAGSAWTITGAVNQSFIGIQMNPATTAINCLVEGNFVRNLNFTHAGSNSAVLFAGIKSDSGNNNLENNTIGGAAGSITISSTWNSTTASQAFGIQITAGIDTILNNTISGITFSSTTGGLGFTGIFLGSAGNSLVDGNTISNINHAYNSTLAATYLRGIATSATGVNVITNNTISNLTTATAITATDANASLIGIVDISGTTTAQQIIRGNTISNLRNTAASASVQVTGIAFSAGTSPVHEISKNFIHSLSLNTTSTTAIIRGIHAIAGIATYHNNMIRLGIDETGASLATGHLTYGIHQVSTTAGNSYYYNSIYIGGSGVAGANNTFAYARTAGTTLINIRNNIFTNARSNGAGTGTHYAMGINSLTGLASPDGSNNNIFYAPGTGGQTVLNVATPNNLAAWQATGRDALSYYADPFFVDPTGNAANVDLHLNPTLPTQAESNAFAVAGGPYGDIDGDIRFGEAGYSGTGSAPDIGADENDFNSIDLTPPVITYTPILNQLDFNAPTLGATITDAGGVNVTAGTRPRIYFKRSTDANTYVDNTNATNGWKFVETASTANVYSLQPDYSLLFGGAANPLDIIEYFVVAQDIAAIPNFAVNTATFATAPSGVALTAANFPATGSINSFQIMVLNGTYTANSSGTINSLTNPGGFFELVNSSSLAGNVTLNITSDLLAETGTITLNQWPEINGSGYTLTIQSDGTQRTIRTAVGQGTAGLIRLTGADRVTFNGGTGAQRLLLIQNTTASAAASTFSFGFDAQDNTINNCTLEGSVTSAVNGVILFTSGSGSGNDNNTIIRCDIKDYNGVTPHNGIYSAGNNVANTNNNNNVIDCNIYNFFNSGSTTAHGGINLGANNSLWTIENNRFFQTNTRNITNVVQPFGIIYINNTGVGYQINGNQIGGSAADGTGLMDYTTNSSPQLAVIFLNAGNSVQSLIEGNTIQNLSFSTSSAGTANQGAFSGIYLGGSTSALIKDNIIGSATGTGSIVVTVSTNANGIVNGIKSDATNVVEIDNNIIGGITVSGTGTNNGTNFYGIHFTTGTTTVTGNKIGSSTTANSIQLSGTATTNASVLGGIFGNTATNVARNISGNEVSHLTNLNTGTNTRIFGIYGISLTTPGVYTIQNNSVRALKTSSTSLGLGVSASVMGIGLNTANTGALTLAGNTIYGLYNTSSANSYVLGLVFSGGSNAGNVIERNFVHSLVPAAGTSAFATGIQYLAGAGSLRNNKVRLGIDSTGTGIAQAHTLYGIDVISVSATNIFHNSVYLGGDVLGTTALNSISFRRTAATGTINIQNNILMNARTQSSGGKHYCIFSPNITTFTSNYNILYPIGTGTFVGLFNTTDALTLVNWRALTTNRDLNSFSCDPAYENPTGSATTIDLHLNATTGTAAEGRGNPVALTPPVLLDFDGETRDTPALNTVDIGADAGNYIPLSGPTLNALANSANPLTTCSGNTVTLTANPTGGSFCAAWQYSWFNGSLYWNGTDFASATEVFNTSWVSISAPVSVSGTYTVRANCSGDLENCIPTTQSTVEINLNTSPTTLTPVIGNPANGLSHFIDLSWATVAGVTAYDLEFSTDNSSWNSLYSGTNLSFSHNTGDSPNAPYYYRVRSVFGAVNCNWTNATTFPIHTAADAPNVVVLTNATSFTMDLALQAETPVANPSSTTYSVFCPTNNLFVQANGSLGATEVFQTMAAWGTTTVTGLIPDTEYCFYAIAQNNDGDVREGIGSNAFGVETFTTNANFATGASDLTRFWSPSTCTTGGLQYFASDGCTDGYVGRSGTFTGSFGCFLRTPEVNCTGNATMKMFLDVSNSFFASQPNDRIRFYMWADNQYIEGACTSVKIDGIEVSQTNINGRFLPFNVARNCVNVEVTFNLSSVIDKSAVLFYAEPNNGYNNANLFVVKLDNISVFGGPPPACLSTSPLVLNGDYTVGSGGDFPSLTNPGGLFEAVNQATLSGNVTATVISDLTAESGTFALNQWVESGAGNYTLTLRPNDNTTRIIEGNYVGANATLAGLYRINGADRFIIDGRDPANIAAGGRHLLFRNLNATNSAFNSTFNFINDANDNIIRYSNIEGSSIGAASTNVNGVVRFSTGATTGNDNNTIDHCHIRDANGNLPVNAIYADGTYDFLNPNRSNNNVSITNNEIYNFWGSGTNSSNGILIISGNNGWNISGNSIYQTDPRTASGTVIHYGIQISNNSDGDNFIIENNFIGGSAALATGTPWTILGTSQVGFMGISVNIMTSATSLVQSNTITNFNINSTRISAFPTNTFNGILSASNGATTINNNTIGATTGNGAITINNASTVNAFSMIVGIGHSTSTGDVNITNNNIGSFTLNSSSSYPITFNGIRYGQGGSGSNRTISGNLIGSLTSANSIENNTNSNISSAQDVIGIQMTGGANAVSISNNTIANMHNNRPSANAGQTIGINSSFASNTITENTIFNLTSTSINTGVGSNASIAGILLSATSANNQLISQNTIYSLRSNATTAATSVIGIYYGSSTGTSNSLSRNLIHSLSSASSGASIISGIYLGAGNVVASNNMVRLGIDANGNSLTASHIYHGIVKDNTANNNQIYYNSVYIGGTGVSTTANATYAFRRLQTGTGDNVNNNIFFNARANSTTGGKHYGVYLNNASTLTMSHNLIFTNGNGGVFGGVGAADYASLALWQIGTSFGSNTVSADPSFVNPTAGTPDLRLSVGAASAAESAAIEIVGLTDDFDALNVRIGYPQTQIHGGGTAPDIGADETDMIPVDVTPPNFSYTFIPTQSAACSPIITSVNVTIIDGQTGISLTNDLPRMYFRRRVGAPTTAWSFTNSVQGTYVSGTSNNSIWNFTLDYASFGITPTTANEFEYYFVAQDQNTIPNVGTSQTNGTSPIHSNVSTIVTPANFAFGASGAYTFAGSPLSGTVTVGSGGDYPNFNNNGTGLFQAIMSRGISSNLEVLVISNVDESADYFPLGVVQEFCGSGYTITIKPNAATNYVIQSNTFGANPLINFIGTKRVIIDGSFDGAGRFLTFRQRSTQSCIGTSNPTFYFSGTSSSSASEIEIRNSIIEGNNRLTGCIGPGVMNFGNLLSTGQGMNNIIIDNNVIRNRSDLAQSAANTPWTLIQIGAPNSVGIPRSNIHITNNEMSNFAESAIQIRQNNSGQGIGNGFVISGNKIYQPINITTYHYPIWLEGGTNSHSHVIANNLIGGNASPNPNITGTWLNSRNDGEVQAIYVLVGGSNALEATSIQGNKIQNINISGTGWTNFVGIRVEAGRVRIGDEVGNIIGSEDNSPDNIISNGSGGSFITEDAAVMGIWTQTTAETIIENNIISGLSTGLGTFCFMDGIAHGSNLYFNGVLYNIQGGKATIRNNVIANNRSTSNLQNSAVSNEGMINLFVYTNSMENLIEGNLIQNNGCNALVNANVRMHGVMLGVLGQVGNHGGIFRKNTIAALANANAGQASPNTAPEVNGLVLNHGNWEVSNNMISLRNGTTGTHIDFRNTFVIGIRDHLRNLAGQGAQYLYNSVYLYGVNGGSGTGNPSYNYLRIPNNAGTVAGAPTTLRNNILINSRTGLGSHRAIGNINTGSPATGWNSSASNYNFVATANTAVATRWGTTDYTFANWRTITGGDANSDFVPVAATTIANTQIQPTDLFESDYLFGNLRISLLNTDATNFIDNKGIPLVAVTDDIDGDLRNATTPDIGADEFNFCASPFVTLQPVDQLNICVGNNAIFTSTVGGLAPLTYQWQESTDGGTTWGNLTDAGIYSGTATNTLTLTGVTAGLNNNQYRLNIDNTCGNTDSDAALLTVPAGPVITGYSPLTFINSICSGNTNFQVTATGNNLTYQWQESVDNGTTWNDVVDGAPYSGATTNQLNFSNIPPPNLNGNKYRLILTDDCGEELISNEGTLIIGVAFITAQPIAEQTICSGSTVNIDVASTGLGLTYQWQYSSNGGTTWNNATLPDYSGANTANLSFTASTSLNGYLYRAILNSSVCPGAVNSDASLLNVEFPGLWLGNGTDWDTPANWGCGVVPTTTTDVLIPTNPVFGNVFPEIASNNLSVSRNLTIESGASVTILNGRDLSIYGNLTNNGSADLGLGATRFRSNTTQIIDGTSNSEFWSLIVDNSNTTGPAVELNQDIIVINQLIMENGKLHLNSKDIDMLGTGVLLNESNSNRVYGDAGEIKTFITLNANTNYADIFGLGVSINTGPIAPGLTTIERGHFQHTHLGSYQSIQRYYDIVPANNTALDATLRIAYFDDEMAVTVGPPPVKANLLPWRSVDQGITWEGQFFPGNLTNDIINNWVQLSNIPAFSRWTLSDWVDHPLPIQLLSFTATADYLNQAVDLEWITASEINNAFYTVERSANAVQFQPILSRAGAGNSNTVITYTDVDLNPMLGVSYYRLKQTDFDGNSTYSDVVPVNFNQTLNQVFNAYSGEKDLIRLNYFATNRGKLDVKIFDAGGRLIGIYNFSTSKGSNQLMIDGLNLAAGVYIIQANDGEQMFFEKLMLR